MQRIIAKLSDEEKLANHIPEWVWEASRNNEVFIEDERTKELIRVLDLTEGGTCVQKAENGAV